MDGYYGVIQALGFQFAPLKWGYCNGALLSVNQYAALYSLISTYFGGDGRVSFGLPDLRGRSPIGQFQGPGTSLRTMGQMTGAETVTLSLDQLPTHTHTHTYAGSAGGGSDLDVTVEVASSLADTETPAAGDFIGMPSNTLGTSANGKLFVSAAAVTSTVPIGGVTASGGGAFDNTQLVINNTGGSQPVDIMQPSLVVNYCICMDGLYPTRS
ncbi:phage tail protein [Kordiimonas marina]|uniref:phage tail protein n=1 Tax=Kordiimonas marina TaxID=2872312 RepID=UPI001FF30991|nr:tail fiber protein [Kordiimonas marina]MCJ9429438.1 tail fiber protein [Kordiimonas marina]